MSTVQLPGSWSPHWHRCLVLSAVLLVSSLSATIVARAEEIAPVLRLTGEAPGDAFGASVAAVGDVNGDGYGDVLVGAPGNSTDGASSGRAYLYFGGPLPDAVPDLILSGDPASPGGGFGGTVSSTGDFNGDGYSDFMVYGYRPPIGSRGYIFLYFGGPNMDAVPDIVMDPYQDSWRFGPSMARLGDFDGDGYDDLIVGRPARGLTFIPEIPEGEASIMFGGPTADGESTWGFIAPRITGCLSNYFGVSVAAAGDVNGDGYDDAMVLDPAGHVCGGMLVFMGGPRPFSQSSPFVRLQAPPGPLFGPGVPAGDWNQDGFGDVLASAPGRSPSAAGYLYFGGQEPFRSDAPDLILRRENSPGRFGTALAFAPGALGDGRPCVVVAGSSAVTDTSSVATAKAYVFVGGAGADSIPDVVLDAGEVPVYPLISLSAGDMDGDRIPDIIVGAPDGPGTPHGCVLIFDIATSLPARAFPRGGSRTISLVESQSQVGVQLEPMGAAYQNSELDLSSLRLLSGETGDVSGISPVASKRAMEADTDGNGVPELSLPFARSDISKLFSKVRGRRTVEVSVEGRLQSGRKLRAPFSMTVLGTGKPDGVVASVAPNPVNPQAKLTFTLKIAGNVTVKLYDVNGRLVRSVAEGQAYTAGTHAIRIDDRDDRGAPLASGVYFYRIECADGETHGRLVVAK